MSLSNLLCSLCTIQSLSTSVAGDGQVVTSYSSGTQYQCRLDPQRGGNESQIAARRATQPSWVLFLDAGSNLAETSRIVSESNNYNVTLVHDYFGHHTEADLERIL